MIRDSHLKNALYALNGVLIRARAMAAMQAPYSDIAAVLDVAELLPMLIANNRDETDWFRRVLEGLVQTHPGFDFVLQRFDGEDSLP